MVHRRHMYHYQGMTDLAKAREDALKHVAAGGRVTIHLHEHHELAMDGCPKELRDREDLHEVYQ